MAKIMSDSSRSKYRWLTQGLVGVLSAVGMMALMGTARGELAPIRAFIAFPIAVVAAIVLHEAGHALTALMVGWRVIVFNVTHVSFQFPNRNLAFGRKVRMGDAAGFVLSVPGGPETATVIRHMAIVAGGPVASLIGALLAAALAYASPEDRAILGVNLAALAFAFSLYSGALFVLTALPIRRTIVSDGLKISDLMKRLREGAALDLGPFLVSLLRYKVRVRDIPRWLLDGVESQLGEREGLEQFISSLHVAQALDHPNRDLPQVHEKLDEHCRKFGESDWYHCCKAFTFAAYQSNLAAAKLHVSMIQDPCDIPTMEHAAKAATARLAGDLALSEEQLGGLMEVLRSESPYRDTTFQDIMKDIRAILPLGDGDAARFSTQLAPSVV